jgi:hypothetical protein
MRMPPYSTRKLSFVCDVCGRDGIKDSPNQRRHSGKCAQARKRQRAASARPVPRAESCRNLPHQRQRGPDDQ